MKRLEKIKTANYKQLAIDHGEKLVVVVICVLVVSSLLFGTRWKRFHGNPQDFLTKVADGERELFNSEWPEARRLEMESIRDVFWAAQKLQTDVDITRYEYSTRFLHELHGKKQKIKDPQLLPVYETFVRSTIAIFNLEPTDADHSSMMTGVIGVEPGNDSKPSQDSTAPPSATAPTTPRNNSPPATSSGNANDAPPAAPGATGTAGGNEPPGTTRPRTNEPNRNAEGRRFIVISGLFPLQEQIKRYMAALDEKRARATELIELMDFELQRKTAIAGAEPWMGAWEKVDISVALDILYRTEFALDVIDFRMTDRVITMPLPVRFGGNWDYWASHPGITKLTKQQRELQNSQMQKIIDAQKEQQARDAKDVKRGFASLQHSVREYARNAPGLNNADTREAMTKFSLAGKVLLFRYLDFDIEPGNAYKYRVRLVLSNPNYLRPIQDLENPESHKNRNITTPWSAETPIAFVKNDLKLFLSGVAPGRGSKEIAANLEVFDWFASAGTTVAAELAKIHLGQFIASYVTEEKDGQLRGGVKTEVLRPAQQSLYVENNVEIDTHCVLVALNDDPMIASKDHPDLKLNFKKLGPIGISEQALVVDRYGDFKSLDNLADQLQMAKCYAAVRVERAPWRAIAADKQRTANKRDSDSALDKFGFNFGEPEDLDDDKDDKQSRAARNPLKKRRTKPMRP